MAEKKRVLVSGGTVSMSAGAAQKLISGGDGNAALLYIYILSLGGEYASADASRALKMTAESIAQAEKTLSSLGLIEISAAEESVPVPEPAEELPQYTAEDIKRSLEDGQFMMLARETEKALGRVLSSDDLMKLLGIYDALGLPFEVVLQLVNYCVQINLERYGPGRRTTMRFVEREAFKWERLGAVTLPLAEEHIKNETERRSKARRIASVMGISGRPLSKTEAEYIASWLEMGFGEDAAAIAYDRTVVGSGKLSWKYMDSIMRSWHQKGLHTEKEILVGDRKPEPAPAAEKPAEKSAEKTRPGAGRGEAPTEADLARMKRMIEKLNGGGA